LGFKADAFYAEPGYRYFDADYSGGGFTYDVAQSGVVIGLNFKF